MPWNVLPNHTPKILSPNERVPVLSFRFGTFTLLILFTSLSWSQVPLYRLHCAGEMPEDFRLRYSDKYQQTLSQTTVKSGKKEERKKKEFAALTNVSLDNLIRSGKVLYGDPISRYCSGVLDILLADQPGLREEIRIYTLRSADVNAYATHQGIILITTGLMARLENEAELAFILAHEVAHYTQKHSIESYWYNKDLVKNDAKNRRMTDDEKVLASASYSRESEREADSLGLMLFLRAGYAPDRVAATFDKLLYSYLPLACREFNYQQVQDSFFRLSDTSIRYRSFPVMAEEDTDDSRRTHPNNLSRKALIFGTLSVKQPEWGMAVFRLDSSRFFGVVDSARLDVLYSCLIHSQYIEALMLTDVWEFEQEFSPSTLARSRAMSWYGIQLFINNKQELIPKEDSIQGPQASYYHLFSKASVPEINLLATRELFRLSQLYPNDTFISALCRSSEKQLAVVRHKYFIEMSGTKTGSGSSEIVLQNNSVCKTCRHALDAPEFAELRHRVDSLYTLPKATGHGLRKTDTLEFTGVKRLIVLSPRYFGMDLRKRVDVRYLAQDSRQSDIEELTRQYAKEMGIELVIPDSRSGSPSETDDFNRYVTIMDWMQERSGYAGEMEFQSFLEEDMDAIKTHYNADYLMVSMYWSLINRRKFEPALGAMSAISILFFPVYLYWQFSPQTTTVYAFLVMNLNSGNFPYADYKVMPIRLRRYVLKAHLYNSMNQLHP